MYEVFIKNMKILIFKDLMKKKLFKNVTMDESDLQRVYKLPIYPRDSKLYSVKVIVKTDNGSQGGTHWICFIKKNKKSN